MSPESCPGKYEPSGAASDPGRSRWQGEGGFFGSVVTSTPAGSRSDAEKACSSSINSRRLGLMGRRISVKRNRYAPSDNRRKVSFHPRAG